MTTKKQILKLNIVMGIVLLLSVLFLIVLVWGKQVWFYYFFIYFSSMIYNWKRTIVD